LRNLSILLIISALLRVIGFISVPRRCVAPDAFLFGGGVEMAIQWFKENPCGEQWTGLELPDIVHMRLQGKVTIEECRMLNEAHLGYGKEVPYFFYLIDLTELDDLPPAVRKEASETVKLLPLRGTVVKNAPLKAKVLARLLLTAANLFRRGPEANPLTFCDTEEEARAWYEKRRQQISEAAA
jgi:hypothetical protein